MPSLTRPYAAPPCPPCPQAAAASSSCLLWRSSVTARCVATRRCTAAPSRCGCCGSRFWPCAGLGEGEQGWWQPSFYLDAPCVHPPPLTPVSAPCLRPLALPPPGHHAGRVGRRRRRGAHHRVGQRAPRPLPVLLLPPPLLLPLPLSRCAPAAAVMCHCPASRSHSPAHNTTHNTHAPQDTVIDGNTVQNYGAAFSIESADQVVFLNATMTNNVRIRLDRVLGG